MASNYPASLDSFDTIASDKKTSDSVGGRTHRDMHNDLGDAIEAIEAELGTDPSGGSATVKARLDAIGTVGTGSPEGVVTAAPGSTWLQTDATTDVKGWLRWIKATGTGNTGWIAGPEADTGWRNVTSDNAAKFQTWNALRIRRVGSQVFLLVRAAIGTGTAAGTSTAFTLYTLPSGFLATEYLTWGRVTVASVGSVPAKIADLTTAAGLSTLSLSPPSTGTWADSVAGSATWATADAWPTSLPGSAA